ncbi:MAG: pyridoxine 5'-phosphate synthase [Deltaproteobacteria bacterium]|nr:pyridoxine 5'-phosphate synthase [Deltaproteobacteria bacterium]
MIRLSVNVNKVAVVRNSRGGTIPGVLDAVEVCLKAGAKGITVHPRADQRHITPTDVREIANYLGPLREQVEFNIEGDPRPDWLDLVREVRPHQATLVPVRPGERTSEAGWSTETDAEKMKVQVRELRKLGIRVSLFVAAEENAINWAREMGADRVELYTGPFAEAYSRGRQEGADSFARFVACAELAHRVGLGINAGHDLDLENLELFRRLPYLDEVSIGHAIISRAIFQGLAKVVGDYLNLLSKK